MADDVAVYEFFGVEYKQTYLTIEQAANVADLFESFDFTKMNAMQLFKELVKNGGIDKFFNMILVGEKKLDAKRLTLSQGLEVIEDFLSYNDIYGIISRIFSAMSMVGQQVAPEMFSKLSATGKTQTGTD